MQGTRLAKPYDKVEDAIEDATAKVSDLLDKAASRGKKAPAGSVRSGRHRGDA